MRMKIPDIVADNIDEASTAFFQWFDKTHLVSRFACNARVIVDASSNPMVSHVKIAVTKPRINSSSKQTNIASIKW